jgi:hypothetical protein
VIVFVGLALSPRERQQNQALLDRGGIRVQNGSNIAASARRLLDPYQDHPAERPRDRVGNVGRHQNARARAALG